MGSIYIHAHCKRRCFRFEGQNLHKLLCVDIIKSSSQPLWMVMKKLGYFLLWLPVGKRENQIKLFISYAYYMQNINFDKQIMFPLLVLSLMTNNILGSLSLITDNVSSFHITPVNGNIQLHCLDKQIMFHLLLSLINR
jgi:hypothetical protein